MDSKQKPKDIIIKHDSYTFHVNPNNLYRIAPHVGTAPLGWYVDYNGFLQFIHRDSVYGRIIIQKAPKENELQHH